MTCSDGDNGGGGGSSCSSRGDGFFALDARSSSAASSSSKNALASASSSGGTRRPDATAGTSSLLMPTALESSALNALGSFFGTSIGFGRGDSTVVVDAVRSISLADDERAESRSVVGTVAPLSANSRMASACRDRIGASSKENVARVCVCVRSANEGGDGRVVSGDTVVARGEDASANAASYPFDRILSISIFNRFASS